MPFMKGPGALRRTVQYLEKGPILLRDNVKILTFNYNPGKRFPHHDGLTKFVYWHVPQLKYKNPDVQIVTMKMMTPSPFIKAYLDDEKQVLVDCDSRSREEILDHLKSILGKPVEMLQEEGAEELAKLNNPANFGFNFDRQCICEMPGQVPCPGFVKLPLHMTGKGRKKLAQEAES